MPASCDACDVLDADCGLEDITEEGAVRLTFGFGTLCDPLHTGVVEVFHAGQWGAICGGDTGLADDFFARGVPPIVCRELGFAVGTAVAAPSPDPCADPAAAAPGDRVWLTEAVCRGPETQLRQCRVYPSAFLDAASEASTGGCGTPRRLLAVACRQFPITTAEMEAEGA